MKRNHKEAARKIAETFSFAGCQGGKMLPTMTRGGGGESSKTGQARRSSLWPWGRRGGASVPYLDGGREGVKISPQRKRRGWQGRIGQQAAVRPNSGMEKGESITSSTNALKVKRNKDLEERAMRGKGGARQPSKKADPEFLQWGKKNEVIRAERARVKKRFIPNSS